VALPGFSDPAPQFKSSWKKPKLELNAAAGLGIAVFGEYTQTLVKEIISQGERTRKKENDSKKTAGNPENAEESDGSKEKTGNDQEVDRRDSTNKEKDEEER
jgi:hypothetical protein